MNIGHKIDVVTGAFGPPNYLGETYRSPTWGELPYQYRMSKMGWDYGRR